LALKETTSFSKLYYQFHCKFLRYGYGMVRGNNIVAFHEETLENFNEISYQPGV
jgi:hypothetical protein